jgi:hypothetical protein
MSCPTTRLRAVRRRSLEFSVFSKELLMVILGSILFIAVLMAADMANHLIWIGVKRAWLTFKWKVRGIPPCILDDKTLAMTVDACVAKEIDACMKDAIERGVEYTTQEMDSHRASLQVLVRSSIESYIDKFSMQDGKVPY